MDMNAKKAILRTTVEIGTKIFSISLVVSVTAILIGKAEYTGIWKALVPFGSVCWVVGFFAKSELDKLLEPYIGSD
jgi:hypothetical protein